MEIPIEEQRAALSLACDGFRSEMLENDTLLAIVSSRNSAGAGDAALPDFDILPTLKPNEDGTDRLGVRFDFGVQMPTGSVGVAMRPTDYLSIADVNLGSGETRITEEFKEALESVGVDSSEYSTPGFDVLTTWMEGWLGIARSTSGFTDVDPVTHVPVLKNDIEHGVSASDQIADEGDDTGSAN